MRARAALLFLLAACSFNFDSPSDVKDLRILAIQAQPPELTPATNPFSPVVLRALIVDVGGDAGTPAVSWSSCLKAPMLGGGGEGFGFGSSAARCPEDGGTVAQGNLAVQPFAPPRELAFVLLSGIKGLTLQWQAQLEVEGLVGVKEITVSPSPPPGQAPNQNPHLNGLTFDDEDWPAGTVKMLKFDACPAEKRMTIGMGRNAMMSPCRHEIAPLFDAGTENQVFFDTGLSGQVEEQKERLRFSWFTDRGEVENDTTVQPDPSLPFGRSDVSTFWREPTTKGSGPVNVWVVVRDGRGGTSWELRQVAFE